MGGGRELFRSIYYRAATNDYLISARALPSTGTTLDDIFLLTVNVAGIITSHRRYTEGSDDQFLPLVRDGNDGWLLLGNGTGSGGIGRYVQIDPTLSIATAFPTTNTHFFYDAVSQGIANRIMVGRTNTTGFITQIDFNTEVWTFEIPESDRLYRIIEGSPVGSIRFFYVLGRSMVGGIERTIIYKISVDSLTNNVTIVWAKHLEDGETAYSPMDIYPCQSGAFTTSLLLADGRELNPNGFGDYDAMLGVFDTELTSSACFVDVPHNLVPYHIDPNPNGVLVESLAPPPFINRECVPLCYQQTPLCSTTTPNVFSCDSLIVNDRTLNIFMQPDSCPYACCFEIDLFNKTAIDISKVDMEILTPDWIFSGLVTANPDFILSNTMPVSGPTFTDIEHLSGSIPPGNHTNVVQFCITKTSSSAISPQEIVFRWYQDAAPDCDALVCADTITVNCGPLPISPKVFLQGPFSGTLMNTDLNTGGLLPTTEPYTALGYTGLQNAGVSIIPGAFSQPVVDWVIVELRDPTNPTIVVTAQAALLLSNGCVVSHDGGTPVHCCGLSGNYYVAIRHRNHLAVMTNTPISLN